MLRVVGGAGGADYPAGETGMEIWVLTFFITAGNLSGRHFNGGLFQSEALCEVSAVAQVPHWRRVHGRGIDWHCRRSSEVEVSG